MFKFIKCFSFLIFITIYLTAYSQKKYKSATVAFYNLENLFDTINSSGFINGNLKINDPEYHISIPTEKISDFDTIYFNKPYSYENLIGKKVIRPLILQDEFLPNGKKKWNSEKYYTKINNLASVIADIGKEFTQQPPTIVGICEVENKEVIQDLVNSKYLKDLNYGIVHFNSLDNRGIDVGLIYLKDRFITTQTIPHPVYIYDENGYRKYTRDILQVSGYLDNEEITFLVNHWPSRSSGEKITIPHRIEAARVALSIINSIKANNKTAKIILMGDFNDDPNSTSIKETFNPIGEIKNVIDDGYYNGFMPLFKKGIGTLAYRDSWNLFDQIITTSSLITKDKKFLTYKIHKVGVYNKDYLINKEGSYKGYPNRMWNGDNFKSNGYSDHFPVYTILLKEIN